MNHVAMGAATIQPLPFKCLFWTDGNCKGFIVQRILDYHNKMRHGS
jgi:hypothetical protein